MLVVFAFRHHTYNKVVNTLASSVLAIYLITDSAQLRPYDKDIFPIVLEWWGYLVAMGICLGCILIDKVRIFLTESFIKIITRVIKRR